MEGTRSNSSHAGAHHQTPYRRAKGTHGGNGHAKLPKAGDHTLILTEELADLYLQGAELVGHLLHVASVGLGETLVHLAHVVRYGLGEGLCPRVFVTCLDKLLLLVGKCYTYPRERTHVAHQCLAHQVGNAHGILARGVQPFLLGQKVVHGRQKRFQRVALAGERGELLQAAALHRAANDTQLRLGTHHLVDSGHVSVSGRHPLPHHGCQLRLRFRGGVSLVYERLHSGAQLLKAAHAIA